MQSNNPADVSRRLLILDLNGTLLLRARRSKGSQTSGSVRLRAVHPRPYISSFRAYLFHPATMNWLDTMVWSSAQPHSVADMVNNCFGKDEPSPQRNFLAMWARDTLGLSPEQYNQKTQTTKNLEKIWHAFPIHSSASTILLDDSPLKARLQPWNHLCVPDYTPSMRAADLSAWRENHPSVLNEDELPKRARKYDETLLAVIGILDHLKGVPDVAAWTQGRGLVESADPEVAAFSTMELAEALPNAAVVPREVDSPPLWFENKDVRKSWVKRGKAALKALGIAIDAGVAGSASPTYHPL